MPPAKGNQKPCELWGEGPGCEIPLGGTFSFSRVSTTCIPLSEKSHLSCGGKWWKLHIAQLACCRNHKFCRHFFMQLDAVSSSWALYNTIVSFQAEKNQTPGAYGCASPMAILGWHPSPWPKTSLAWPASWTALAHTPVLLTSDLSSSNWLG